jgi:DNA (cytosine-5)-methyltransferase 1
MTLEVKMTLTFIDLFAGMGGIRLAFEAMGAECVFSSEWDAHAQQIYQANFGEVPYGDITQIASQDIPHHDILLGGFPCQPFSIIGDKLGFADTRGTLFFEIERILRDKQPQAFLLENVKQLVTHDDSRTFGVILNKLQLLGYTVYWRILNALHFGLPQKRERVFIVGFKQSYHFQFPTWAGKSKTLDDILEDDATVDKCYIASAEIQRKRQESTQHKDRFYPSVWHENKGANISILPYSCALRAGASFNYLLVNGQRRLTPREMLRLQGFPESYQIFGNEGQIRRLLGNSVAVPVVEAVAKAMVDTLKNKMPLETVQQLTLF